MESGVFPFLQVDFFLPVSGRGSCVRCRVCLQLLYAGIIFNTRAMRGLLQAMAIFTSFCAGIIFSTRAVVRYVVVRGVDWEVSALLLWVYFFLPASE